MVERGDENDPKGLIREAYRIEGISLPECRSIFMDWALSIQLPDPRVAIRLLLDRHGEDGHPMTQVLTEGLNAPPRPARRGGRAARVRSEDT